MKLKAPEKSRPSKAVVAEWKIEPHTVNKQGQIRVEVTPPKGGRPRDVNLQTFPHQVAYFSK